MSLGIEFEEAVHIDELKKIKGLELKKENGFFALVNEKDEGCDVNLCSSEDGEESEYAHGFRFSAGFNPVEIMDLVLSHINVLIMTEDMWENMFYYEPGKYDVKSECRKFMELNGYTFDGDKVVVPENRENGETKEVNAKNKNSGDGDDIELPF